MAGDKPLRIPFDSLTLCAVAWELQQFVGGKVQRISQPDEYTVGIGLYSKPGEDGQGGAGLLLLSSHPQFFRAHLSTKRLANQAQPPAFCAALRARLEGGYLAAVRQIDFDRILELEIEHPSGTHTLIAELMSKHANLILTHGKCIVSAIKFVGKTKSIRPVQSGGIYERPPFPPKPAIFTAAPGSNLKEFAGASPLLIALAEADPTTLSKVRQAATTGAFHPVLSPGHGAYPLSVAPLGVKEFPRASISVALEQHYDLAVIEQESESLRASLLSQLNRVALAREVAIHDLAQAEEMGKRAGEMQLNGELILAYGSTLSEGATELEAYDYEGNLKKIKLDPELDFKANANFYFDRAKHAKSRMGLIHDQRERLSSELAEIQALVSQVESSERLIDLRRLQDEARGRRWLHKQPAPTRTKEERPYEGHRVRELLAPGGWTILYGENAESNDYLTVRVAKPNDWWIHIRGNTSAHVVIVTKDQPEKVSRETILYAAKVAVQNSPSKHAGYVPVDYTLKKYVRKPKGSAKGTALYTHEKTIHVEGDRG